MTNDAGFEALANEIIIQAARDYRSALGKLYRHPNDVEAKQKIWELESFFRSVWYEFLTDVDGAYLIRKLRQDFREQMVEKERKAAKSSLT